MAGLSTITARFFQSWLDYVVAELWVLVSIYISLDYTVSHQVVFEGVAGDQAWQALFVPSYWNNSLNALILVPILVWIYYRFNKPRIFGT